MTTKKAINESAPFAHTRRAFKTASGRVGEFYSIPALAEQYPGVKRLPISLQIVLESVLRHAATGDGKKVHASHVAALAQWQPAVQRTEEIPFVVSRVVLQDFTGVPLLADLAAMRSTAVRLGKDPKKIEPLVPVDLVVDHSVTIDYFDSPNALDLNMKLEFKRNLERYQFLKWGMQAFATFGVVPPGFGIVHQVNLEHLARGVHRGPGLLVYPDTLVGTDSHTTMINGIGVVGWGVGGIEAEAAMLGQPVYLLTPDVVGFVLTGQLREGVTATDLVLAVTETLRKHKVVGKFVEFYGVGVANLSLPDRATIANMAPEYGATMGFFTVDEQTLKYFQGTGRSPSEIEFLQAYFEAQGWFGATAGSAAEYSAVVRLDLGTVTPSLAGPKRPQDRIELGQVANQFDYLFSQPTGANGFNQDAARLATTFVPPVLPGGSPKKRVPAALHNGDVLIAAITSCTNTSNPGVLLAAGLLAKKAVLAGLRVAPHIKTSLAPGSQMVTEYLSKTGLLPYLEQLGFSVAGYGCTTCIGNAGDLAPEINATIVENDLVCAAVLSGNRNFEARIHPNLKANFLASPPLVVAYALAGTVRRDLMTEPVGWTAAQQPVYLGDIWPSSQEIQDLMHIAMRGASYRDIYARIKSDPGPLWTRIKGAKGWAYTWPTSTYIAEPPFFAAWETATKFGLGAGVTTAVQITGARIIALFGDSITTDHISPAGSIAEYSPAGQWLLAHNVPKSEFNSYGARRGNHEVMMRGTFANVRIKNRLLPVLEDGTQPEGGWTIYQGPTGHGDQLSIYDAAMRYQQEGLASVVFAGEEYGTGSSRDWAAKGTQLLGIKAVIARSFERIHRSNLVGMGVLPLQFGPNDSWQSLQLNGSEVINITPDPQLTPQSKAVMTITRADGSSEQVTLTLRIDTPIEVDYYRAGGILPFVLEQLLA